MPGSGTVPSPRGLPPVAALHAALGVRRFSFSADQHAGTAEPFRVARPQAVVSNLNDESMTNDRMTNDEAGNLASFHHSAFVIDSSFWFRHSSFHRGPSPRPSPLSTGERGNAT